MNHTSSWAISMNLTIKKNQTPSEYNACKHNYFKCTVTVRGFTIHTTTSFRITRVLKIASSFSTYGDYPASADLPERCL